MRGERVCWYICWYKLFSRDSLVSNINHLEFEFDAFPGHQSTSFPSDAKGMSDYNVLRRAKRPTSVVGDALSLAAPEAP
jgi:hypothetical protein